MNLFKKSAIILALLLAGDWAYAPTTTHYYQRFWVRLTAYSPKEIKESARNHKGHSIRNEEGIAVPKGFLPDGAEVILPDGSARVVDDRMPRKTARRYSGKVIDVRYYGSITARPKTKAVSRELCKRDMDYGYIWIRRD